MVTHRLRRLALLTQGVTLLGIGITATGCGEAKGPYVNGPVNGPVNTLPDETRQAPPPDGGATAIKAPEVVRPENVEPPRTINSTPEVPPPSVPTTLPNNVNSTPTVVRPPKVVHVNSPNPAPKTTPAAKP